ncbi:UNVERIFIED_CONTAM: hypothetical protein FKN15_072924 [Acipenser sinensis]
MPYHRIFQHPKQSDPGFEYAGSSPSCPSPLKVFLPFLNKSQASPHQEVYHSSHPEVNDGSLKHPKQSDPGFEYAGSSPSCPSPLKVFLPFLNKSQVSPHQEVYHSSHPEVNDGSLKESYFHACLVAFKPNQETSTEGTIPCELLISPYHSNGHSSLSPPYSHLRATELEDHTALGSLQAGPQMPGQSTGVAGVR